MYERNEQRGNVKLHQQSILYVKMYFKYSGAALAFRILSVFICTAVVIARVCLCFVLSVTPVGKVVVNMNDGKHANAMPGVTQSAYTKPSLPAVTIAFFPLRCLCFVQPHLCWYLSRQRGDTKSLALV